jgi:sterol 14alpha-demethylase
MDHSDTTVREPRMVSGARAGTGHLEDLQSDPIGLMRRVHDECGEVGAFDLAGRRVVLLAGAEANEWYFRAPEEDLDQAEAYPFMTPVFGEGIVFDASPERRREMMHNQALRDKFMRGHAETISEQVEGMIAAWDRPGQVDLLEFFAELTIYTSSACLIGKKFRGSLDGRFAELFHDLERGTDATAFVDPYADIESFHRRDAARVEMVALLQSIMDEREAGPPATDDDRDLLDVLMSIREDDGTLRFDADMVTGMFISMMFAGHHTTSTTASWTLLELLKHPEEMDKVMAELDALNTAGEPVTYQALREMPHLESSIKEALRLHPPLILLLRVAQGDFVVCGHRIAKGDLVGASPAISNRLTPDFERPDAFDPDRYLVPREEDLANPWTWIPFGAGRHRCVGAAFALMQLKCIFAWLLPRFEFALAQPPESYHDDVSKMVIQLAQPCTVTMTPRVEATTGSPA